MQFKISSVLAIIAATATVVVNATPTPVVKGGRNVLDIWSPRIISPDATTVWVIGSVVNVTWDTSNAPEHITPNSAITLNIDHINQGYLKDINTFSLLDGFAEVTVPNVVPGNDYSITLFGDSGNTTPDFQIVAA